MTAPASPVELPQLPEQLWCETTIGHHSMGTLYYFSAEQMHEFGQQCYEAGVRAERACVLALCAAQSEVYEGKMSDAQKLSMEDRWERMYNYNDAVENISAAIRKDD